MNRRSILVTVGCGLTASVAGCLEDAVEPKEHPEIPDPLTAETVVEFVEEYETVEYHNAILSNEGDPDSIDVGCEVAFHRDLESGFYAVTTCSGSTRDEDLLSPWLGSTVVSDLARDGTAYRVDE